MPSACDSRTDSCTCDLTLLVTIKQLLLDYKALLYGRKSNITCEVSDDECRIDKGFVRK